MSLMLITKEWNRVKQLLRYFNVLYYLVPEEVASDFVVGSLGASCRLPVLSPESFINRFYY